MKRKGQGERTMGAGMPSAQGRSDGTPTTEALTAQPVGVNAPARRRVSRSVKWLLSVCILLGGGGVLHGGGRDGCPVYDKDSRVGIGNNSPKFAPWAMAQFHSQGPRSPPRRMMQGIAIAQKDHNVLVQSWRFSASNSDHPLSNNGTNHTRREGRLAEKPEGFQVSYRTRNHEPPGRGHACWRSKGNASIRSPQ